MLERLTDKTSQHISVNEVRRESFCLKSPSMDRMPPTQDALLQTLDEPFTKQESGQFLCRHKHAAIPPPQEFAWIK